MVAESRDKSKRSRLAFVQQGGGQVYVEVLPVLPPRTVKLIAAGVVGLGVVAIAFLWLVNASAPIVSLIFTMMLLAGVVSILVALLGDTEYPKLWLEPGKLTVQWHAGHVEALRIGRHSAIVLLQAGEGDATLMGFTVQGEEGAICFRELLSYVDFVALVETIDRACFAEKSHSPKPVVHRAMAAGTAPVVGPQAVWSKQIRMLVDQPKRLEFLILWSAASTEVVLFLGFGSLLTLTLSMYFLARHPSAGFAWFGGVGAILFLASWVDWVTKRTRVTIDTARQQVEIVRPILGIPIWRRLPLSPTTIVGLRPVSISNDVPSFGIAIGTPAKSVCIGSTLDNEEARLLMYRLREVIGVADEVDAFFSVAAHEQLAAGGKSKEVLETQLPLDSAISIRQYDDDCVRIRLPAVEYAGGRVVIAMVLAASVAWTCSWLLPIWSARGDRFALTDAVLGGCLTIPFGLLFMLACLYGMIGQRLLTITPDKITYSWRLGPLGSWLSAKHVSALKRKLGTADPYEQLHSLPSVQRGLAEIDVGERPGRLPEHLESLATRIGQRQRTRRELASLLTEIHREWPNAQSLQPRER